MSGLFRYTIIGEALEASIKEVQEKYPVGNDACERIRTKFDEVAAAAFSKEENTTNDRGKPSNVVSINATEHEFKFNDGVWRFILKNVKISLENGSMQVDGLKVIACNSENHKKEGRRRTSQRQRARGGD